MNSDEGRKVQDQAKKKLNEVQETVSTTIKNNAEVVAEKVNVATETTTSWANDIAQTVKSKINKTSNTAENFVEDAKEDFESGADRARREINKKAKIVADIVDNEQAS